MSAGLDALNFTPAAMNYFLEVSMSTVAGRAGAALLLWHRLYGWPALREMERRWPMLRSVPPG